MELTLDYVPTISTLFFVSTLLRISLILYSDWHDAHSIVKYTDVDYRVFSDAARFILRSTNAKGPYNKWVGLGE